MLLLNAKDNIVNDVQQSVHLDGAFIQELLVPIFDIHEKVVYQNNVLEVFDIEESIEVQVAMDDLFLMEGCYCGGDLEGQVEFVVDGHQRVYGFMGEVLIDLGINVLVLHDILVDLGLSSMEENASSLVQGLKPVVVQGH